MDRIGYHKGLISVLLTGFVIALLLLSGPVSALTLSITQPNNADKGTDVSFSITSEINDPDLLPISYTNLIITGPNGFSKTCKINSDGTDDCADVDVTVSSSPTITYAAGSQYGYDAYLGFGYNLGYGFGYQGGGTGTITYDVVWHTPSTLEDGTYNANAEVFAQGSSSSHTFSSSGKSFSISTASGGGGGGSSSGGGTNTEFRNKGEVVEPVTPAPIEPTVTTPKVTSTSPSGGNVTEEGTAPKEGLSGITGAVVGAFSKGPVKGIGILFIILILGLIIYYNVRKGKK